MKKYKTWEVIKMLTENPKIKFQTFYKNYKRIFNCSDYGHFIVTTYNDGEEIDFSLGDVVIQSEGTAAVPALVNPAERQNMGLLSINGLTSTKFELTTLTKAQYDAVTQVNDAPITSLADPAKDAVKLVTGKVYSFKSSTGKKGLIYISSISAKTGTIQNTAGEWIKNTSYSQVSLTAKTVKLP
jgi:hypothetical protein